MSNHERESSRSPNRDAALDHAWQQASDEQPPSRLDAAIIAAARRAVDDRHEPANVVRASPQSRSWLTRWQPLAAAAAVAGLAFVLVQSLPRERDVAPSIRMEEPAPVPATTLEMPRSPSARTTTDETTAASPPALAGAHEAVIATGSERCEEGRSRAWHGRPKPRCVPGASRNGAATNERDMTPRADGTYAVRATDAEHRNAATSKMATGVASAEVAAAPVQESRQVGAAPLSAADRAAKIAALYAAGDVTGAADALRAFRADDSGRRHVPAGIAARLGADGAVTRAFLSTQRLRWHDRRDVFRRTGHVTGTVDHGRPVYCTKVETS